MAYQGGSYRGAVRKGGSGAIEGGVPRFPDTNRAPSSYAELGTVISGMWWRGGTVGWLGKMPISSHHWACTPCHRKGRLEWLACGSPAGKWLLMAIMSILMGQ